MDWFDAVFDSAFPPLVVEKSVKKKRLLNKIAPTHIDSPQTKMKRKDNRKNKPNRAAVLGVEKAKGE